MKFRGDVGTFSIFGSTSVVASELAFLILTTGVSAWLPLWALMPKSCTALLAIVPILYGSKEKDRVRKLEGEDVENFGLVRNLSQLDRPLTQG